MMHVSPLPLREGSNTNNNASSSSPHNTSASASGASPNSGGVSSGGMGLKAKRADCLRFSCRGPFRSSETNMIDTERAKGSCYASDVSMHALDERGSLNVEPPISKSGRNTPRRSGSTTRVVNTGASEASTRVSTPRAGSPMNENNNNNGNRREVRIFSERLPDYSRKPARKAAPPLSPNQKSLLVSHHSASRTSRSVSPNTSGAASGSPFGAQQVAAAQEEDDEFDPVTLKYDPIALLVNGEHKHNQNLAKHAKQRAEFLQSMNNSGASRNHNNNNNHSQHNVSATLLNTSVATNNNNSRSNSPSRRVVTKEEIRAQSRSVSPMTAAILYGTPPIEPHENIAARTRRCSNAVKEQMIRDDKEMNAVFQKGNIKETLSEMRRSVSPTTVGITQSCFGLAAAAPGSQLTTASPMRGVGNGGPPSPFSTRKGKLRAQAFGGTLVEHPSSNNAANTSASSRALSVNTSMSPSRIGTSRSPNTPRKAAAASPNNGMNTSAVNQSTVTASSIAALSLGGVSKKSANGSRNSSPCASSRRVTTPRGTVVTCDYASSITYEAPKEAPTNTSTAAAAADEAKNASDATSPFAEAPEATVPLRGAYVPPSTLNTFTPRGKRHSKDLEAEAERAKERQQQAAAANAAAEAEGETYEEY